MRSTRRRRRTSPSPDPGPYSKTPVARLPEAHRPRIERRYLGTAREGDAAENMRLRTARSTVQDTADAQGDVDAFIDRVEEDTRKDPAVAAGIARRLLAAGRAVEALETAEAAEVDDGIHLSRRRLACDDARIDALDALERRNGAQRQRWTCFERALAARYPLAATLALRAVRSTMRSARGTRSATRIWSATCRAVPAGRGHSGLRRLRDPRRPALPRRQAQAPVRQPHRLTAGIGEWASRSRSHAAHRPRPPAGAVLRRHGAATA